MVPCLGSCMELVIVFGFLIFLPEYLETQFSLGKYPLVCVCLLLPVC